MNIRPAKATLLIDSSILLEVLGVPYESDNSEEVKDKFDGYSPLSVEPLLVGDPAASACLPDAGA
ncbi:hypothetical protein ROTO_37080 [Roseovarius tolerans]|uniref:Uncharacterized protein n=1 Tax=Roseovarius tolerans TaxID=74031 RepID=A0A0L6CPT3_9RHOB|nr:hypothetical protein ROTO_37080 [Roseovarius tolerans]